MGTNNLHPSCTNNLVRISVLPSDQKKPVAEHEDVVFVIAMRDALVDPRTVMVEFRDARAATRTMVAPIRLHELANVAVSKP